MLGKLMKHEFRATGRFGLPLCGVMIALSAVAGMALRAGASGRYDRWEEVGSFIVGLYGVSVFAVAIGVFIILIQHFKRNLLGDEGYLMRTLPVSIHELLLSKLFVALLWYVASTLLIILSGLLVATVSGAWNLNWLVDADFQRALRKAFAELDAGFWVSVVLWTVGIMAIFTLLCYADCTLSQSFSKHKVLYNVMAVVIFIVLLRLVFGLNSILDALIFDPLFHAAKNANSLGVIGGADGPTAIFVTTRVGYRNIIGLIELYIANVGLYFLTWAVLRHKPNLE